jgi:hypothetical protein
MFRSWSAATRADVRAAIWFSWLAMACIGGLLIVSPYVVAQSLIQEWVAICPAKASGNPCSLCGMTTAFYLIAGGRFEEATASNYASVPLYSTLLANALVAVFNGARTWWRARHR